MMYAVDIYSYTIGEYVDTEYFESSDAAISRAQELEAAEQELGVTVLETTGESGGESKVIYRG